ncbi:hypothetical protein F5Y19DRAFT_254510 [Xylariaceae sp. FL1651]|nr:hypothetical protein F5Y19DRAFT_254510 [Xylariaceae sp. FL1651]
MAPPPAVSLLFSDLLAMFSGSIFFTDVVDRQTPTPHRFLVPRRSQPRSATPKPAFQQPGGQQFQTTPRFSLHSTPRAGPGPPPSSSVSVAPFRHRGGGGGGGHDDVVIDSSPPPLPARTGYVDDGDPRERIEGDREDDYEEASSVGNDVVQEFSPIRDVASDGEDRGSDEGRLPKRRRISVSSSHLGIEESSPFRAAGGKLDVEMRDEEPGDTFDRILDVGSSFLDASPPGEILDADDEEAKFKRDDTDEAEGSPVHHREKHTSSAGHQPTFQRAPRFKPAELPEGALRPEPLPDAFSPRRKGAKYMPGGLAAELRDWLVDIEAGIGSGSMTGPSAKRDEEWVARVRVGELRGGHGSARGMTLVLGRLVLDGKNGADEEENVKAVGEVLATSTVKIILAGPGRLVGLGVGNEVKPGVLLGIARPTWEVVLDGLGRWGVACDWVVLR